MIKGTIKTKGQVTGTVNPKVKAKGVVSVGGVLVGAALEKRGLPGTKGDDGHSPSVTASRAGKVTTVYVDGSSIATINDGNDGQNGSDGQDGHSPVVTASKVGKVTTVSVDGSAIATINDGNDGQNGQDGQDGADGYSPSASVSKSGSIATITITDKNGTTTADVYDGSGGGASAFIAEYGVTPYADVKDAYDENAIILCTVDDSGNTVICQLSYYDDANEIFYFAEPMSDGFYWASIASGDTWDDGFFQFASTDTATTLENGLMSSTDKTKLDGIASGAEVNVNADWNAISGDAQILNKPTIPSKTSDLNNDSGFITTETDPTVPSWAKASSKPSYTFSEIGSKPSTLSGYGITDAKIQSGTITLGSNTITPLTSFTETDPIFTASDAYGIDSTDITNWDNSYDGKVSLDTSAQSGTTDGDLYAAIVALGWENDVIE